MEAIHSWELFTQEVLQILDFNVPKKSTFHQILWAIHSWELLTQEVLHCIMLVYS